MHNYTTKIRNHEKRWVYKCRTLEMNLQLREQQLKTISYTYRIISKFQNNCKPKIYNSYTKKEKSTKYNTKIVIKPQDERTRQREWKRSSKHMRSRYIIQQNENGDKIGTHYGFAKPDTDAGRYVQPVRTYRQTAIYLFCRRMYPH